MKGDRVLYAALAVILIVSSVASLVVSRLLTAHDYLALEISVAGEPPYRVELRAGDGPVTREIASQGGGLNILLTEGVSARMVSADCPGGDCLRMPPIGPGGGGAIVCLPHRVVIRAADAGGGGGTDVVSY